MTFGNNCQYTLYFSVDHRDTNNVTVDQIREAVERCPSDSIPWYNASFELPILHNTWGKDHPEFGDHGSLPNVLDTAIPPVGRTRTSHRARRVCHLGTGYTQTTYESHHQVGGCGHAAGGRQGCGSRGTRRMGGSNDEGAWEFAHHETRQYKMNRLTGQEVLALHGRGRHHLHGCSLQLLPHHHGSRECSGCHA